jgi:hypothetical protein
MKDPLHTVTVTSISTYSGTNQVITAASSVDWMANLGLVAFVSPDDTIQSINLLPNAPPSQTISFTNNSHPELLLGDEIYTQTMVFNVTAMCSAIDSVDTITAMEASCLVPAKFR